jgi:hypothetical protein
MARADCIERIIEFNSEARKSGQEVKGKRSQCYKCAEEEEEKPEARLSSREKDKGMSHKPSVRHSSERAMCALYERCETQTSPPASACGMFPGPSVEIASIFGLRRVSLAIRDERGERPRPFAADGATTPVSH